MASYWFWKWLQRNRVKDRQSLSRAIKRPKGLDSLLAEAPPPLVFSRRDEPDLMELTAGKGIDLTGDLGCHDISCLSKEIDGLFRHAWHYFDRIRLPDQACACLLAFERDNNIDALLSDLEPFVLVLHRVNKVQGLDLVSFEVRTPACSEHFKEHATEADIANAFADTCPLVDELASTAEMFWERDNGAGHLHLEFRLDSNSFEHSEWGTICSLRDKIPRNAAKIRESIARHVVRKYLAGLSADALAARRARTPLGSTIPFYRRLLAGTPSPRVEDVAFELALPITTDLPTKSLIALRRREADCFARFQHALTKAITERLRTSQFTSAAMLARQIKRDIIEPELRKIRDKLKSSRALGFRSASTGVSLGTIAATVGLLSPIASNPVGVGLAVGGAITLGASAVKKAVDDHLAVRREVVLSDMYFLWKGHRH